MFFKKLLFFLFIVLFSMNFGVHGNAIDLPEEKKAIFNPTGLKLPRFVSLAKEEANIRTGPGQKYPVKWVMKQKSLPVEIILEFENWRKIRDFEGQEGWIFHALLSGRRTALIASEGMVDAYAYRPQKNDSKPRVSMRLAPLTLVKISECLEGWCQVRAEKLSGWIEIKSLWGVYEHENID